jgi:small subunit ribosomal protein S11e
MATELTVQSERAYQKQPHIFLNHKSGKTARSKKVGKGGRRWFKDVGLGFRTPKTAIEGSYIGQSASAMRQFSKKEAEDWIADEYYKSRS